MALKNLFKGKKKQAQAPDNAELDNMSDEEFDEYLRNAYNSGDYGEDYGEDYGNDDYSDQPETEEAAEEAVENEDEGNTPYKTFDTEADYNKDLSDYVNTYYGDQLREGQSNKDIVDRVTQLAKTFYGTGDSEEAVNNLISDLESSNASNSGMDVDTYRQNETDRRDLEAYRARDKSAQDAADRRREMIDGWNRDAERLKQSVPEFDLEQAFQNERFREMVTQGASVPEAYYAIQYDDIKSQTPQQQPRGMRQNALSTGSKPGSGVNDMMSMDDNDFRAQLKKIMNYD